MVGDRPGRPGCERLARDLRGRRSPAGAHIRPPSVAARLVRRGMRCSDGPRATSKLGARAARRYLGAGVGGSGHPVIHPVVLIRRHYHPPLRWRRADRGAARSARVPGERRPRRDHVPLWFRHRSLHRSPPRVRLRRGVLRPGHPRRRLCRLRRRAPRGQGPDVGMGSHQGFRGGVYILHDAGGVVRHGPRSAPARRPGRHPGGRPGERSVPRHANIGIASKSTVGR